MGDAGVFLKPLLRGRAACHVLRNATTGLVVATRLEVAVDGPARRRGLLGRDHISPETAFILAPCSAIHTWFMRFPIDVIFVSRSGEVVATFPSVRAWRIAAALRGFAAIELASGALSRSMTSPGHRLVAWPAESQTSVCVRRE